MCLRLKELLDDYAFTKLAVHEGMNLPRRCRHDIHDMDGQTPKLLHCRSYGLVWQ